MFLLGDIMLKTRMIGMQHIEKHLKLPIDLRDGNAKTFSFRVIAVPAARPLRDTFAPKVMRDPLRKMRTPAWLGRKVSDMGTPLGSTTSTPPLIAIELPPLPESFKVRPTPLAELRVVPFEPPRVYVAPLGSRTGVRTGLPVKVSVPLAERVTDPGPDRETMLSAEKAVAVPAVKEVRFPFGSVTVPEAPLTVPADEKLSCEAPSGRLTTTPAGTCRELPLLFRVSEVEAAGLPASTISAPGSTWSADRRVALSGFAASSLCEMASA